MDRPTEHERRRWTETLTAAAQGDPQGAEALFPLVYGELRQVASARMAKLPPGHTLRPTELVHEAYLRVQDAAGPSFEGKAHFFFAASRAMRDILVEDARRKSADKRGGGRRRVPLEQADLAVEPPDGDVLGVSAALEKLERVDTDHANLVLLRYFSGFSVPEIARILETSVSSVERQWRFVRAWLQNELERGGELRGD